MRETVCTGPSDAIHASLRFIAKFRAIPKQAKTIAIGWRHCRGKDCRHASNYPILHYCRTCRFFAAQFLSDSFEKRKIAQDTSGQAKAHERKAPRYVRRQPTSPSRQAARTWGDIVEVKAGRNGHFLVDADVNFSSVRFIVDTGASFVALRQSDAEAAGIFLGESDFRKPVSTANGTAFGAQVQLESVSIEGIDLEHVSALVLPDDRLGISLLGNSFLSRLQEFHVSGNQLIMKN